MKKRVIAAAILSGICLFVTRIFAQSPDAAFEALRTQSTLCEARYRNGGFNAAISFVVGCLNPAFQKFFVDGNAPGYMYESDSAQTLLMGAKVDSKEIEFDEALKNIAGVANVAILSLVDRNASAPSTVVENPTLNADTKDVRAIDNYCRRAAEVARYSVAVQFGNECSIFVENNPPPSLSSSQDVTRMIRQGQLDTLGVIELRRQEELKIAQWKQRMAQSNTSHENRKTAAVDSAFSSSLELCKLQNGLQ